SSAINWTTTLSLHDALPICFRREKFIPFGGPDGGDGGKGADVYLVATAGINTLADFRYQRTFKAPNGQPGGGAERTGASGTDLRSEEHTSELQSRENLVCRL